MKSSVLSVLSALLVLSLASGLVCGAAGELPNPQLTPGAVDITLTTQRLCDPKFSTKSVRNVPESLKKKVYAEYGYSNHQSVCAGVEGCEIDHLISLEIGGQNDIHNLWPQPFVGTWNAHMKDQLENKLHALVCSNQIPLSEAQQAIATNWIQAYQKYMRMK